MATTIGKLAAVLTGNTKGFTTSFKRAGDALKSFSSRAASVAAGMGAFAVFDRVTQGITNFTRSSFESIDATGKLSDTLGIATESLVALQYAADLSGVSNEELTAGLGKMLKTVGDARMGSDEASQALFDLGVSLDSLSNLNPEQMFSRIADRLNQIEDPTRRAAVAMKVFGKNALSLFPLLKEGSQGLAAFKKEGNDFGLLFSRIDAKKVEQANDSFTKLGYVLTAIGQRIAIEISPYLTAATTKLLKFAKTGGGVGARVVAAMGWVTEAIAKASDNAQILSAGFYSLSAVVNASVSVVIKQLAWLDEAVSNVIANLTGGTANARSSLRDLADAFSGEAFSDVKKFSDAMDAFHEGRNAKAVREFFGDIKRLAEESAESITGNGGLFSSIGSFINSSVVAARAAMDKLKGKASEAKGDIGDSITSAFDTAPKLLVAGSAEAAQMRIDVENKARADKAREIAQSQLRSLQTQENLLRSVDRGIANLAVPVIASF